ncbi:alpha/beta hydrolase [Pendulispora brunnea]|uniref:Alpha/beta hydrolase n=1 Tax=Pendulispora brunnea TaxID=2905690 RepID=A0ABZ2K713_9BACT
MTWVSRHLPTCLGRIHVRLGGNANHPAIMFWPSLLMDGTMWSAVAEHFEDRYRVVLVDSPGHGESEPLARKFAFDECALCISEMLDGLEMAKTIFVGNSWGAMVGGTFAARHPERVVASVLMNGTASVAGFRQKLEFFAMTRIVGAMGGVRGPMVGRVVRAFLGPTALRENPAAARAVRESVAQAHVTSSILATESVVSTRPDQHALLATIRTPVLVVAGDEDPTFSLAETQRMASAIPGAEFHVMPRTGHLAALERPAEVAALIESFLGRVLQ